MMTTLDKKVKVQVALIQAGLILFSPGIIVLLLLGWVWRWFVLKWGAWRGEFLHPVSGLDLMFITDTPHQPHSVILMIQVLSGTPTKDRVVADLRRVYDTRDKDGKRCFWKLGTYPKEWMGYWVNKEVDNFDIENQVTFLQDWKLSTPQDVNRLMEHLLRHRVLPCQPWLDFIVAPNYLDGPGSLLIIRFSHAMADGYSMMKLFFRLAGFDSLPPDVPQDKTTPVKFSLLNWLAHSKRLLTEGLTVYVRVWNSLPQNNIFRRGPLVVGVAEEVTGYWNCAITPQFPLEKVTVARKAFNTSFYGVVVSAVVGGLREFARGQGWEDADLPDIVTTLLAMAKSNHPDGTLCNHWRPMILDLPIGNGRDTISTLKDMHTLLESWKVSTASEFGTLILRLIELFPVFSRIDDILSFCGMTLISSITATAKNVPQVFGQTVEDVYHFMPIHRENIATLAWGSCSSNGHLRISVTAEKIFFPRREHVYHLADCIHQELNNMYELALERMKPKLD